MLQVGGAAKCPQDKGRNPALNRCAFGHLGRSGISTVCTRKGERMHGGVMFSVHNLSRVTDVHTWECGTDIRLRSPERPRVRECVSSLCGEEVNRFLLVRPAAPTAHPVTPCRLRVTAAPLALPPSGDDTPTATHPPLVLNCFSFSEQ